MPNVWDIGSARLLAGLGFEALATTSSGFAASLGRQDQHLSLDELVDHVEAMTAAVDVPLSVDSESGYGDDRAGLETTVDALAAAGAAGVSIEDYRPGLGLLDLDTAVERVGVFAEAAGRHGMTVTARAENHLYGVEDLDDTIERLRAYASVGARVAYAPGLLSVGAISRVVADVPAAVNVLLIPGGPSVPEMREAGVRRLSTGGALAWVAYGAAVSAAKELRDEGTQSYAARMLSSEERSSAFEG